MDASNPSVPALDFLLSPHLGAAFMRPRRLGVDSAWHGHVPFAHWITVFCAPRLLVELGTHHGVSYFAFCGAAATFGTGTRAIAVDTWDGDEHAGRYDAGVHAGVEAHNAQYASFSTLLRCTFSEAAAHVADGSVDLLHIDGLHTYEAVRADWEEWRPKLSDRAVVLFHDTQVRERDFGVWRLWAELRAAYPAFEFTHCSGLGVLVPGPHAPAAALALCALDGPGAATAQDRFAALGERWMEHQALLGTLRKLQRTEADLADARAALARALPHTSATND